MKLALSLRSSPQRGSVCGYFFNVLEEPKLFVGHWSFEIRNEVRYRGGIDLSKFLWFKFVQAASVYTPFAKELLRCDCIEDLPNVTD